MGQQVQNRRRRVRMQAQGLFDDLCASGVIVPSQIDQSRRRFADTERCLGLAGELSVGEFSAMRGSLYSGGED